jgi:putative intracellular protease/amidase
MKITHLILALIISIAAAAQPKKILIVSTNIDSVGANASGTYLMEIAIPFKVFTDRGYQVDIVTAKGGRAAIYGKVTELLEPITRLESYQRAVAATLSPAQVKSDEYSAVFYPGGHGQYFDVVDNADIARIAAGIYEGGGVVGTAGHGVASLVNVKLSNGHYLVEGKRMTCFPHWAELKFMNISEYGELLAFDMEVVLRDRGADLIVCTEETRPNKELTHIADQKNRIVTGAFASSAGWVAEEVIKLIDVAK